MGSPFAAKCVWAMFALLGLGAILLAIGTGFGLLGALIDSSDWDGWLVAGAILGTLFTVGLGYYGLVAIQSGRSIASGDTTTGMQRFLTGTFGLLLLFAGVTFAFLDLAASPFFIILLISAGLGLATSRLYRGRTVGGPAPAGEREYGILALGLASIIFLLIAVARIPGEGVIQSGVQGNGLTVLDLSLRGFIFQLAGPVQLTGALILLAGYGAGLRQSHKARETALSIASLGFLVVGIGQIAHLISWHSGLEGRGSEVLPWEVFTMEGVNTVAKIGWGFSLASVELWILSGIAALALGIIGLAVHGPTVGRAILEAAPETASTASSPATSPTTAHAPGPQGDAGTNIQGRRSAYASNCPSCGHSIQGDAKFCPSCGSDLHSQAACPSCGNEVDPDGAFCGICGTQLQ